MSEITFGEKIKELRVKQGLSLRELAKRVGVSAGYLSQLERNLTLAGLPSENNIKKFADVLNIDADTLVILAGRLPSDVSNIIKKSMKDGIVTTDDILEFVMNRRIK